MAFVPPTTFGGEEVGSNMAVQEEIVSGTPIEQETDKANLACEKCKRRKIKCDRTRPACRTCQKTSASCSYPTTAQKPGPKPGIPQRRKVRRVNGPESNHPYPSPGSSRAPHTASSTISNDGTTSIGNDAVPLTSDSHRHESVATSQYYGKHFEDNLQHLPRTQPSSHGSVSSPETQKSTSNGPTLSNLLNLSHDPVPNSEPRTADSDQMVGQWRGIEALCADLEISSDVYPCLLTAYFDNMTAFSLFHRPTFDAKISSISSPIQQRALIASMFAFSARFTEISQPRTTEPSNIPSYEHFRKIAEESVDQALRECLDDSPPLCLLQALTLTTFQQLANGVRGRSWRAIHTCVSIAYDLRLHLVDKNKSKGGYDEANSFIIEEKRRAWWVIWEFDVFASTIRKLPTAIDWANNESWLPIDDELWFSNTATTSCMLHPDPAMAWKQLEKSGNRSAKAWFIVINALMRCAHMVSFPQVYSNSSRSDRHTFSGTDAIQEAQSNLDILANSLYCVSSAIPSNVSYNGEFLNFSTGSVQHDSAKLSIYVMTQLSRFMLHHLRVFNSAYRQLGVANSSSSEHVEDAAPSNALDTLDKAAWNVYLAAASEIVNIVRNSSPKHVRYVNPFLSSTIWLAAAAQIVSRKIGPHLVNRRVAESNFDLLQMNLDAYVSFWGVSSSLQQKLNVLAAKLETVSVQGSHSDGTRLEQTPGRRSTNSATDQTQQSAPTNCIFAYGRTIAAQYAAIDQQVSMPSLNTTNGSALDVWSGPQPFSFGDALAPDLNAYNMWGYGLDELLMYGGFE